jgi:tetratricopeptide (TPR) repeat protein
MIYPPHLNAIYAHEPGPLKPADWELKEQKCLQALKEFPDDTEVILHILKLHYYVQEKHQECLEICERLLALNPETQVLSDTYAAMGTSYMGLNRIAKAVESYEKGHDVNPDGNCLFSLGEMYLERYEYDKAIETFKRLKDLGGWDDDALENLGHLYKLKKDYKQAAACYTLGMELYPDQNFWLDQRASMIYMDKRYAEAEPLFRLLLERESASVEAHYGIGCCKQDTGDYYLAMHHFHEALKLDPKHARSLNNIGKLYFDHEGDIKTAIQMIEKAIKVCKEEDSDMLPTAYLNLKRVYKHIADEDKADYYHVKFMESFGFGYETVDENGDEEEGEDGEEK